MACLFSLASIFGPILMTQIFGYFTSRSAPLYLPGASFYFSAALASTCWFVYRASTRESMVAEPNVQGSAA